MDIEIVDSGAMYLDTNHTNFAAICADLVPNVAGVQASSLQFDDFTQESSGGFYGMCDLWV